MAVKSNTKRIVSHIRRMTMHLWLLGGALVSAGVNIDALLTTGRASSERLALSLSSLLVFIIAVLAGLVMAIIRGGNAAKRIADQEASASLMFDADDFKPVTAEKNLMLGREWLVINTGPSVIPLAKASIASADPINNRKEGMKKLWARITDKKGKSYACIYKAAEPDGLAEVQKWLAGPAAAAVRAEAPAPQRTFALAEGDCPFCTGPNEPGASVCRWCGKDLQNPAAAPASFAEPVQAKPVIQPVRSMNLPEETGKPASKSVYVVIGVLLIILAVLLYLLFGR